MITLPHNRNGYSLECTIFHDSPRTMITLQPAAMVGGGVDIYKPSPLLRITVSNKHRCKNIPEKNVKNVKKNVTKIKKNVCKR